ncbi:hypothetical protein BB561_003274 [Smittium simulii]|uniref:Uncharacterized protein n=1 Tax=Smittium simulii TaxID=133385 RepID=A0A2T9YM67_9FUNG|nr:hypothetical protein BB561_003274 [Smittium simulii]
MKVKKNKANIPIADLLAKIDELISEENFSLAEKFVLKALQAGPENPKALFKAAVVNFELGNPEPAILYLKRCVAIEPESGYEKYMYLGQMSTEHDAIACYSKGIEILTKDAAKIIQNDSKLQEIKKTIAEAYVSMTEIYLSDLCFESDAEQKCESFLDLGKQAFPDSPLVYQTLASVRISQARPEEAKEALVYSISLWKELDPGHPQIPSYENRLALVRLLIECQMIDDSLVLLSFLQKEDDQTVDLWYLYGWIYYLQGLELSDTDTSFEKKEMWAESALCIEKALKIASFGEYCDSGVVEHSKQLVNEIYNVYSKAEIKNFTKNEDIEYANLDGNDDVDWDTQSESEMDIN